ncbi:MAG: hypothetical protein ACE5GN_01530 [Waddliaceae bacterium]
MQLLSNANTPENERDLTRRIQVVPISGVKVDRETKARAMADYEEFLDWWDKKCFNSPEFAGVYYDRSGFDDLNLFSL